MSFKDLPTEEVIHPAENRTCPNCSTKMEPVGKDFERDELVYIPAKIVCRKHYAEILKCPICGKDETLDETLPDVPAPVFERAEISVAFIPRSFCPPELLAHIIFEKYAQAVPLYRQERSMPR